MNGSRDTTIPKGLSNPISDQHGLNQVDPDQKSEVKLTHDCVRPYSCKKFKQWPIARNQSDITAYAAPSNSYSPEQTKVPIIPEKTVSNVIKNRSSDEDGARAN